MKGLFIIAAVVVLAVVADPRVKRQTSPFAFALPSNASVIIGELRTGFECEGRQYGYYADPNNNCQVFHICLPTEDAEGNEYTRMWSFICGEGTMFDQATLVCNYPEESLSCDDVETYYRINDYFGREDREFRDGLNDIFKK